MSAFGSCTYLITEPRTKQCFTDCCSKGTGGAVGGVWDTAQPASGRAAACARAAVGGVRVNMRAQSHAATRTMCGNFSG